MAQRLLRVQVAGHLSRKTLRPSTTASLPFWDRSIIHDKRSRLPTGALAHMRIISTTMRPSYAAKDSKDSDKKPQIKHGEGPSIAAGAVREINKLLPGDSEIGHTLSTVSGDLSTKSIPPPALVFGYAGVIPYLVTSLSTLYLSSQVALAGSHGVIERGGHLQSVGEHASTSIDLDTSVALLAHLSNIQVGYGACILSFLGALHWGMEFAKYGGVRGYPRYALGIMPTVIAWPTTLLSLDAALIAQFFGFTATWAADSWAQSQGWTPNWFRTYRFWLTAVVGSSIIMTLAGRNYFVGGGSTLHSQRREFKAEELKERRERSLEHKTDLQKKAGFQEEPAREGEGGVREGSVAGPMETKRGQDAFVQMRNVPKMEEIKKKEKEEAEKKKKEEEEAKAKEDKGDTQSQEKKD